MILFRLVAALAGLTLLSACVTPADLVVKNVIVYDGEGGAPFTASVSVKDGKFAAIDRARGGLQGRTVVEGNGLYMTPGLWDMHAHIANDTTRNIDVAEFPKYGVTTIRDAGGFTDIVLDRKMAIASGAIKGPAIYFVGPTLNGKSFAEFQRVIATDDEARQAVEEAAASGASMIKIHRTFKPELLPTVIEAAHDRTMKITGHIPLGISPLEACKDGIDGIEHIGSFLEALISVAPKEKVSMKSAIDYMLSDDSKPLYECLAERGVNVTPTLVVYPAVAKARGGDAATSPDFITFMDAIEKIVARLYASGVSILAGTDSAGGDALAIPPGVSLLDELEWLQKAGLPATEVLKAATTNPARELGVQAESGSIAIGKVADFLLLEGDPGADVANFRMMKAVYEAGKATY